MKWLAGSLAVVALAAAGCGSSTKNSAPPATTTTHVTTQAAAPITPTPSRGPRGTRDCGSLVGGPQNITATNVGCRLARLVARNGMPIGWKCTKTAGRVTCGRSDQIVRYSSR